MKASVLSTVYLDNQRVGLMGDPKPRVAKVVAAAGLRPAHVQVARSRTPDAPGSPVGLEEIVDRTADPATAIYLTCRPKGPDEPKAAPAHYVAWPMQAASGRGRRDPLPAQPTGSPRPGRVQGGPDGAGPEWGAKTD